MSSNLANWPLGQEKVLFDSELYNVKVLIKKTENRQFKTFNSFVDMYILTLKPLDSTETSISLSFDKINLLETIMESFFTKVTKYYSHVKSDFIYQLDLELGKICNISIQPYFLEPLLNIKYSRRKLCHK